MKVLFEIVHPKHYYQFKNIINLLKDTNEIKIIARKKDIVCQLLDAEGIDYEVYGGHGKTMKSKFFVLPEIFFNYLKIVKKFKPDIVVSKASPYAAMIGKIFNVKSCIFPDSEVVTFNNIFVVPISDMVITPNNFSLDYGKKHKRVSGFFEDSYLHPKFLDREATNAKINGLPEPDQKYAVLRFVGWNANHDIGKSGFSDNEKVQLIETLKPHYEVLISSEAPLPIELEKHRFKAPVNRMHHALFNAALYIGDSQTMATEAALCGTPAIRYNSFVGEQDMSNFKLLERKGMLSNCSSFNDVCQQAEEIIKDKASKIDAQNRRNAYFNEVGDINQEITGLLIDLVSKNARSTNKKLTF